MTTTAALVRDNMQFRKTAIRNNIRDHDDGDEDDNNNNIITITGRAKISNDRDARRYEMVEEGNANKT